MSVAKTDAICSEEEQLDRIRILCADQRVRGYSLIQVLHMVQGIYGYLPLEIQEIVASVMDVPLSSVAGVVSFYSFFTPNPRGKHTVRVCLGTACYVRGGKKIVDRLCETLGVEVGGTTDDRKFTFEVARCIGACGLAPAMAIDDTVHKHLNPDKLDAIFAKYFSEEEDSDD